MLFKIDHQNWYKTSFIAYSLIPKVTIMHNEKNQPGFVNLAL